jgi:hypothetical protein
VKTKQAEYLVRSAIGHVPGFVVRGRVAAVAPLNRVFRGVCIEGSSFDARSFYVWKFVMPLYVPTSQLYFNLGERLRTPEGRERWHADEKGVTGALLSAFTEQVLPFVSEFGSAEAIANKARARFDGQDPYVRQAVAYSLAVSGNFAGAVAELDELIEDLDKQVAWQREMKMRARLLMAALHGDRAHANQLLSSWETATIQELGVEVFEAGSDLP